MASLPWVGGARCGSIRMTMVTKPSSVSITRSRKTVPSSSSPSTGSRSRIGLSDGDHVGEQADRRRGDEAVVPHQPEIGARSGQCRVRSAERRVGKECGSKCRARLAPSHYKQKPKQKAKTQ